MKTFIHSVIRVHLSFFYFHFGHIKTASAKLENLQFWNHSVGNFLYSSAKKQNIDFSKHKEILAVGLYGSNTAKFVCFE